jgi:hypothetical protein
MKTQARAKVGGEFGANGEWYEGGKFINTIPANRKKEGSAPKGSGKEEIAPYVWEVAPEGKRSLYRKFAHAFAKVGTDGKAFIFCSDHSLAYYCTTREEVQKLVDRWNAGERWI